MMTADPPNEGAWVERLLAAADDPLRDHEVDAWLQPDVPRARIADRTIDLCNDSHDDQAVAVRRVIGALQHAEQERRRSIIVAYRTALGPQPRPTNLPNTLWDARPELATIRNAAHSRIVSADAVLAATLARIAWLTDPYTALPPIVGSRATLDLCVALVGPSGAGKSTSSAIARELLPALNDDTAFEVPLGSGEGIVDAYFGTVSITDDEGHSRRIKKQTRYHGMFHVDEGASLMAMHARKGSTVWQTIRSAWSGAQLGQANASEERTRNLPPASYRFVLLSGWQPEYAACLLDDAAGGTPQRFYYANAIDPTIPMDVPSWPAADVAELGALSADLPNGRLSVVEPIEDEIRSRMRGRSSGELVVDPLDSHRDLLRLKLAAVLAVLDGRVVVNGEDWALAGIVVDTSDAVRGSIEAQAAAAAAADQAAAVELAKTKAVATSSAVRDQAELDLLRRAAATMGRHVRRDSCEDGCKRRCLANSVRSDLRKVVEVDDALDLAVAEGWLLPVADRFEAGPAEP